jgi:hypothetical protein
MIDVNPNSRLEAKELLKAVNLISFSPLLNFEIDEVNSKQLEN